MEQVRTYAVTLTGTMPLLPHGHDIDWLATLGAWRNHPDNKPKSVPGDDRSPAWTWIGGLYHDGKILGIPSDNLMTCLREGAAKVPVAGKRSSFKRQSQSGMVVNELTWPLVGPKGTVPWEDINALIGEPDFAVHQKVAVDHGFDLFCKPARIGKSKHVRVRAKFLTWTASGTVTVFDEMITDNTLHLILDYAGRYAGLCDWRPSAPSSPGPYGKFAVSIAKL